MIQVMLLTPETERGLLWGSLFREICRVFIVLSDFGKL